MFIKENATGTVHAVPDFRRGKPYMSDPIYGEDTIDADGEVVAGKLLQDSEMVYPDPVATDVDALLAKHGLTQADVTVYTDAEYKALASVQDEVLAELRQAKQREIRKEASRRMAVHVPAFADWKIVDFMVTIAPMLDMSSAPADIQAAQAIYAYAKNRINASKNATEAQLEGYVPAADVNWPS